MLRVQAAINDDVDGDADQFLPRVIPPLLVGGRGPVRQGQPRPIMPLSIYHLMMKMLSFLVAASR